MTNGSLMKIESIAECSPWSILQYFWPALSDNRSQKQALVFFLSERLTDFTLFKIEKEVKCMCNLSQYIFFFILRIQSQRTTFQRVYI